MLVRHVSIKDLLVVKKVIQQAPSGGTRLAC